MNNAIAVQQFHTQAQLFLTTLPMLSPEIAVVQYFSLKQLYVELPFSVDDATLAQVHSVLSITHAQLTEHLLSLNFPCNTILQQTC